MHDRPSQPRDIAIKRGFPVLQGGPSQRPLYQSIADFVVLLRAVRDGLQSELLHSEKYVVDLAAISAGGFASFADPLQMFSSLAIARG